MADNKISKFINHYKNGGLSQALFITGRYLEDKLPGGRYVKSSRRYGLRHGIPMQFYQDIHRVLPNDETGVNVFDREWDVLIILDTCRPEWLNQIAGDYDIIKEINTIRSVGGRTSEWVPRTFSKASDRPVVYIYGSKYGDLAKEKNNVSTKRVKSDDFKYPPAHQITEEAVNMIENETEDCRYIIHYSQPHFPILKRNGSRTNVKVVEGTNKGVKKAFFSGWGYEKIESMYISNTRYVMDEVSILTDSISDRKIALTADHGQLLRESPTIGHPPGVSHDAVREVPWCDIT